MTQPCTPIIAFSFYFAGMLETLTVFLFRFHVRILESGFIIWRLWWSFCYATCSSTSGTM